MTFTYQCPRCPFTYDAPRPALWVSHDCDRAYDWPALPGHKIPDVDGVGSTQTHPGDSQ